MRSEQVWQTWEGLLTRFLVVWNGVAWGNSAMAPSLYQREPNWPPGMPRAASRCGLLAYNTCQPKPGRRPCTHLPWRMHQPHSGSWAWRQLVQSGNWGQVATGTRSTWMGSKDRGSGCGDSASCIPIPLGQPSPAGQSEHRGGCCCCLPAGPG